MYIRVSLNQGQCTEILLLTNWPEILSPDLNRYSHSRGILYEPSPGFVMFCTTGEFPVSADKNDFGGRRCWNQMFYGQRCLKHYALYIIKNLMGNGGAGKQVLPLPNTAASSARPTSHNTNDSCRCQYHSKQCSNTGGMRGDEISCLLLVLLIASEQRSEDNR